MLKWLKQKPVTGHENLRDTDDPLATIQVHPTTTLPKTPFTKSSNPNEVYAVSRVNPLFQEESSRGPLSPGIHSGSSGYDSEPSDDESHDGLGSQENSLVMLPNSKFSHQFHSQDDAVVQQVASSIETPTDDENPAVAPTQNVIKQNPTFVKSIAVAAKPPETDQPLEPLAEFKSSPNSNRWKSTTAIPVPIRNIDPPARKPGDKIGAARLIQQSSNYVQSIRIVPAPKASTDFVKRNGSRPSSSKPSLLRKPSVTFSERVDVADGKIVSSCPRRYSSEVDSIVTDSLLMMTSRNDLGGRRNSDNLLITYPDVTDSEDEDELKRRLDDDGLASFSDSLSRNRIVKQVMTRSSAPSLDSVNERQFENEQVTTSIRRPRNSSSSSKSSFGGIADHYAAAKEIAKEIESYAQGTTKSTRINMVKDVLLSSRGRTGVGLTPSAVSSPPPWVGGQKHKEVLGVDGHSPTLVTAVVHLKSLPPASSSGEIAKRGDLLDETTRVQPQVYVKANDSKVTTTWRSVPSHLRDTVGGHPGHPTKSQPQLTTTSSFKHVTQRTLDLDAHYRQNQGQVQVPIYEEFPPGTSSHLRNHSHDDSDSGNSTDRSPNQDHSGDEFSKVPKPILPIEDVVTNPGVSKTGHLLKQHGDITSFPKQGLSTHPLQSSRNNEKVMIVSGDSDNMVVDLSGVPPDLRNAIIAGSALVAIPDELNQRLEPGYAMIAIPQDHDYEILPSSKPHTQNPNSYKDSRIELDSPDSIYATQNLTQVWNSMQMKGKQKQRITTILPHHPNPDSHTTADFTIEGQPLARQTKRVKRLKTRRCCCRIIGIFIFLIAFLGVIVTLSLVYTKGKHYFGPV